MLIIVTGGTIDKLPAYLADGKTFDNSSKLFGDTHVPKMLTRGRAVEKYKIKKLFMIDSILMTDDHRLRIARAAENALESTIIITHGTDTMAVTAKYLKAQKGLIAKTIVLTGAMVPYSIGEASDALFNLGSATAFARLLPAGVYVVMNGRVHEADNVYKDLEAGGIFRPLR